MNKSELIKALSEKSNIPVEEATIIVKEFFDKMKDALTKGNRVEIRGLGSFKLKEYPPYSGRNPRTGAIVNVSAKRLPFFRAGKDLKDFINK
ncbi:HU family DNA-binding protein [Desulfovibrio litoralis]|uniref:Integration host factor subunit beta n=1 Tax=Desulfovibrio litoralis DSM 11393 TaxID=1121455 RepID=A0A1M7SS69_9BACT|nr:HU family DNA-binding protein [Desulfovibrio litoralis]SHN61342.1 integration host factor subunit beta [Desulfovibrio litoralis DSM 11393]